MSNTATVSYKWGVKGKQPKIVCKQNKRERQTVFGSYNYESGEITISLSLVNSFFEVLRKIPFNSIHRKV